MAASRRYSTIASRNLCPHANISEDGHRRVPVAATKARSTRS